MWKYSFLERVYDIGNHVIGLGVCIGLKQAWLATWLLDENDEDLTTRLALGGDWDSELDDEGYLHSSEKLAPISDGCIALDPLNRAAEQALQQIGRTLRVPE